MTPRRLNPAIMCRRTKLASLTFVFLLLAPALGVEAQGWMEDRSRREGPGLRVGDFELHPGVGVELGWDSNVFYSDQTPLDSGLIRTTAHLDFSTLSGERLAGEGEGAESQTPPSVDFRGGVAAAFYGYFVNRVQSNLEADANLQLTIMPERPFSLTFTENFGRAIRPFTEPSAVGNNYARVDNDAGVRLNFATVGGVLSGNLGYNFLLRYFEGDSFKYASYFTHRIGAGAAFRFLPQTALIYDFRLDMVDYFENTTVFSGSLLSDSAMLRTRIGLNGAISNNVSAMILVGYAGGFYSEAALSEYDMVVGQAELRWKISETSQLALGYEGDYHNSFVGGFRRRDRGYINGQLMMGGSFLLGAEASAGLVDFGPQLSASGAPLGAGGVSARSDIIAKASLFAEYRLTDWLGLNGTVAYTGDFTDFVYTVPTGMTVRPDPAGYQKVELWAGVRVFY